MQFYEYRGYTIYPVPHLLFGSGNWSIDIIINHHISTNTYRNGDSYSTKGEAVYHSIQYGKELIDKGKVLFNETV
jgi:hypothetical protein